MSPIRSYSPAGNKDVYIWYRVREAATVKRIVYKTALMISLSSVAAAGCTADSVDRTLPVQEECFVETSEAVGQEDSGMAEAGINGADQSIIAEADKK